MSSLVMVGGIVARGEDEAKANFGRRTGRAVKSGPYDTGCDANLDAARWRALPSTASCRGTGERRR